MNIAEKYAAEQANTSSIHLYREGTFWRAYERSAYLFVLHIKNYTVIRKEVKQLRSSSVAYIGFPLPLLNELLQGRQRVQRAEAYIEVQHLPAVSVEKFEAWKLSFPLKTAERKTAAATTATPVAAGRAGEELPLYKLVREFTEMFLRYAKDVPRFYRYALAEKVSDQLVDTLSYFYLAATTGGKEEKQHYVQLSRQQMAKVIVEVRLLHELGALSVKQFVLLAQKSDEVSRQLFRWSKKSEI